MKSRCALPLLLPFAFAAALSAHSRQGRETKEPAAKEGKEAKVLSVKVLSCEAFDRFLEPVNAAGEPAKRALVDDLVSCAGRQGTPLLERGTKPGFGRAVFLYRGPASKVVLSGDMTGLRPTEALTPIAGTDLFYLAREFELDARLDYKFVLNDKDWVLDPLNPRTMVSGFGPNSNVEMPEYVRPAEVEYDARIPHGTVEDFTFTSKILNNTRVAKVYLPPSYAQSEARYRTLYVHDGTDYLNFAKINNVVDSLIHKKEIPPILVVMVPPINREQEYGNNPEFARAFATELVPMIDQRYRTQAAPGSRATLGASLGGLIAVFIGQNYPQVFGNVAGQSSGFFAETSLEPLRNAPKINLVFHLDVGTYEANFHGRNLLEGNRRLRDLLREKNYRVQYKEVHEGHSWGSWRARIADALRFFWGTLPVKY